MKHSLLIIFVFFNYMICCAQSYQTTDTTFFSPEKIESITYKTKTVRDSTAYYTKTGEKTKTFIFKGEGSEGTWIVYDKEGYKKTKFTVNNNLREGEITEYYKSGTLSWKSYYKKNLLNGESTHYYTNGKVQWTGNYDDGKMSGPRVCYTEYGSLCDGIFVIHDEDGSIIREGLCHAGKPEGLVKQYNKGAFIKTVNFKDGLPDGFTYHYANQKITSTEVYKNGKFKKEVKGELK